MPLPREPVPIRLGHRMFATLSLVEMESLDRLPTNRNSPVTTAFSKKAQFTHIEIDVAVPPFDYKSEVCDFAQSCACIG